MNRSFVCKEYCVIRGKILNLVYVFELLFLLILQAFQAQEVYDNALSLVKSTNSCLVLGNVLYIVSINNDSVNWILHF